MRTYVSLQEIADLPLSEHMDRSNATPSRCIERRTQVSEQFESGYRKALMLLALLVDSRTALAALTRTQEDPENPELQEQAHFKTRVFNQAVSEIAETDQLRRRVEGLISANAKLEEVRAQIAMTNRSLSEQLSRLETEREQFVNRLSDSEAANKALLSTLRGIYRRTVPGEPDGETARDGAGWSESIEEILKVPEHMLLDAAALRRKGNIADALKLAEQCAKACKRQGQFSGAYVAALYTTASMLKETGDYSEAYRRFASLTRLRKTKPPAQFLGGAFFQMAELREKEGQREQALRLLRRCLRVFPDHAEACRMLQSLRKLSRFGS
jgi:tetratricopeptide (TPR) repeat protein